MIERPFEKIGAWARKIQDVATRIALKAARVSESMDRKVQAVEARRAARADIRAMKSLPRKPTVEFVREVGRGRATVSLYRVVDHRAGTVRTVYGLNRIHPDGRRTRLVTGSLAELRRLRRAVNQSLGVEQGPRKAQRRARSVERAEAPKREKAQAVQPRQEEGRSGQKRWYTLLYIEKFSPDGAALGRVVRNFTDLEEAKAHQARHPGLLIKERIAERPLPQGKEIPLKLTLDAAQRIEEGRRQSRQQEQLKLVVNQPAQLMDRRQSQGR